MRAYFRQMRFVRLHSALSVFLVTLAVFLAAGFFDAAQAASPAIDPSCNKLTTYGFTAGIVYCVLASIGTAVNQYVKALQTFLQPYESIALVVAIMLYGVKLMSSNVQQPIKETMTLVFRVIIGLFCYNEAIFIYNTFVGNITTGSGGIINEAIGWVTGLTGSGGGNLFGQLISAQCPTPPTLPNNYGGYQIWQAFDCMFMKIFGAANPATNPSAFFTSMMVVIAAALFSGTLGLSVVALGIGMFLLALKMVVKSLFLVLMAYLTIGFLTIFAPLIAPLIFFDSQYLTEKFKQWLGFMISTAMQPVFVLGFLALAITVDDQIIEGTFPGGSGGCTAPTYATTASTFSTAPAGGYGQNGLGVCSFTQLFYNGNSGNGAAAGTLTGLFSQFMEQNQTLFNWMTGGSPQGQSQGGVFYNTPAELNGHAKTMNNELANQLLNNAGSVSVSGVTHLKQEVPLKQMMLTLLTFIFTTWCMIELMDIIPDMAKSMTIGVGVNLYQALQVPFEGMTNSVLSGADQGAKEAMQGKGLMSGNLQGVPGLLTSAAPGALNGALSGLGSYIRRTF